MIIKSVYFSFWSETLANIRGIFWNTNKNVEKTYISL